MVGPDQRVSSSNTRRTRMKILILNWSTQVLLVSVQVFYVSAAQKCEVLPTSASILTVLSVSDQEHLQDRVQFSWITSGGEGALGVLFFFFNLILWSASNFRHSHGVRNLDALTWEGFKPSCALQERFLMGFLLFRDVLYLSYSASSKGLKDQRIKCMNKKGIKQETQFLLCILCSCILCLRSCFYSISLLYRMCG